MKETIIKEVNNIEFGKTVKIKETISEIRVYNDVYMNDKNQISIIQNDEFKTLAPEKLLVDKYEEKSYELTRFNVTASISENSYNELKMLNNVCKNESLDDILLTFIHKGAVQDLNLELDDRALRNNNFIETCAKYYRVNISVDNFDSAFWEIVQNLKGINTIKLVSDESASNKKYTITDTIESDNLSSLINDLYNAYVK